MCEQANNGNFKRVSKVNKIIFSSLSALFLCVSNMWCVCVQVEKEVFDKMDYLFSNGQGDGEYRELFSDM